MTKNAAFTEEWFELANELGGDIEGRRAAFDYMKHSTAIVHNQVVACSFVPRLFDDDTWQTFRHTAETTHGILEKVIQRYLDDPEYRGIFKFDQRLADLILCPRGYDALLPYARIDVFLNEDTLECGFCEFNADGSAGSNENREITHSIENTATYRAFAARHTVEPCELFESWVDEFIRIYGTYMSKVEKPRFAICDYLNRGVVDEFEIFTQVFASRGYECVVRDVRDLVWDGEHLRDQNGLPIDAIWRRCVTNDVLEFWDESQGLIEAVRNQGVALIGSFAGHLVHDKQIFDALYHPLTQAFLTDEENAFVAAHIPQTRFLDASEVDLDAIRATKDKWIIKPTDAYGADDVYAGLSSTQEEWEALIDRFANGNAGAPFLVQTYITPFRTHTLPPDTNIESLADEQVDRVGTEYNNLSGLYLFNGRFTGIFSRLGPHACISKQHEGMTAASLHVIGD
jgi:hypothetical protein